MVVRFYSSVAPETTLSSGINGVATSITVGSVTGFPVNYPYTLALDYEGATEELVEVTNAAGTTLTVTRAFDGTSAASHNAGARVRHTSSAADFTDSRTHENSDDGVHGLAPGDVLVGEDAVQTLTNKTLASPVINGGTVNTATIDASSWTGALTGDATATLRPTNGTNVTPTSTGHAFQIGLTSSGNLRMDNNEIMAVNNGLTSTLGFQQAGGGIVAYNNVAADSTANTVTINGVVSATQHRSIRPGGTTTSYSSNITGDTNSRWLARADGANQWGTGLAAADTTLSRTGVGVLTVANSLVATNLTATGTGQFVDLNVTGTATLPQTTASGATVGAAGADWNIFSLNGFKIGGTTFITGVVNRTGPTITPTTTSPDAGQIPDTTMVTLTPAWRPNVGYNTAIACPVTDGIGHGGARLNTDGTLDLLSWVPNNLIQSGGGDNVRFSISFPSA